MNANELKPCPFCGKTDSLSHDTLATGKERDEITNDEWSVECIRCHVGQHSIHTKDSAIKIWNTRSAETPLLTIISDKDKRISELEKESEFQTIKLRMRDDLISNEMKNVAELKLYLHNAKQQISDLKAEIERLKSNEGMTNKV